MGVLDGIRVVELAQIFAGPGTAMYLADQGADVIKIEPVTGDQCRYYVQGEKAFAVLNRNKRGIALDITKPEGKEVLYRLTDRADIYINNFRPGVAERLACDYATLSARNPGLVYAWVTGWGEHGPYADKLAYDRLLQGFAGLMGANRRPDGYPMQLPLWPADCAMPMLLGFGIMMALWDRLRTGRGQIVTTSLLQTTIALQSIQLVATDSEPNLRPDATVYHTYRCGDGGYVNLGILNERDWRNLCHAVELEELPDDPRFDTIPHRSANMQQLFDRLQERFAERPSDEWVPRLHACEVPAAPIIERQRLFTEPQVRENGMLLEQEHPALGRVTMIAPPLRLSAAMSEMRRPSPAIGQHTAEVLGELGYAETEIARLAQENVVRMGTPGLR